MRLRDVMSPSVRTLEPGLAAEEAWALMERFQIQHLVVVEDGRVVGVITAHDLGGVWGAEVRKNRFVRDLMTKNVIVANPDTPVRKAANELRGRDIGCLPVMEEGRLLGIVTVTDLLEMLGRGVPSEMLAESHPRHFSGG